MSGRVVIDPRSAPPADAAPPRAALELDPAGGDAALSGAGRVIRADRIIPGDFSIMRIAPGQYWLRVQKQGIHASEWQCSRYRGTAATTRTRRLKSAPGTRSMVLSSPSPQRTRIREHGSRL
jgi:hypothetical protein